jgi:hypothetical protein
MRHQISQEGKGLRIVVAHDLGEGLTLQLPIERVFLCSSSLQRLWMLRRPVADVP